MKEQYGFLINEIKEKPQLKQLDNEFIEKYLHSYFLTHGEVRKKIENKTLHKKEKIVKEIVKEIRKNIGVVYGSYQTAMHKKKERFLDEENIDALLLCHKSTRERKEFYPLVYKKILNWHQPTGIADIACGFNPISYIYLEKLIPNLTYYVSDINKEDMELIQTYFEKFSLKGRAVSQDATKLEFLKDKDFLNKDTLFLLKALDSFEFDKKNSSKNLLELVPQQFIVVSFPTKSLVSKKEVSLEKRNWFYKFLELKGWKYTTFEIENEIFFLIKKSP